MNQRRDSRSAPPGTAVALEYGDDLAAVRRFVRLHAALAGLSGERVGDLVLAASEIAANTMAHTAGGGRVCVWAQDGTVFCQFRDTGTIADAQAGRVKPPDEAAGGLGLWVVRQVCDAVDIRSQASGTTILLTMHTAGPAWRP